MSAASDPVAPSTAPSSQTVTLVLTDVAGSTRLWADHPDEMSAVMGRHHEIVHGAVTTQGGWRPVDQGEGDAVFAAFDSTTSAVAAVTRFQRELAAESWPAGIDVRVRVGVHTGEVTARGGNLFGPTVNRCARLRGLGAGGQVLLSAPTWELVRDRLPDGITATDLGEHRMKDLTRPERVHQLVIPGLRSEFPPLASLDRAQHNLPVQTSSFLGRDQEISDLVELIGQERLITITGFGGMGKTRLALQVAAELATGDGDGVWFIDLSAVTDPDRIPALIATTLGISDSGDGPLSALLAGIRDKRVLLLLDNLEQLLPDAATTVDELLTAAPGVRILVTCREPLRLRAEHVYALAPLAVPASHAGGAAWTEAELGSLSTYAAVALFISRATAARRGFNLTTTNAAAIAAICARLDGLPLALELAAARTRALSPETLLPRLDQALKVLTGGSRDLPARHQTLRATIAWSYDSLDPGQQQLLNRLSVFPGTFTLDAAEAICGPGDGAEEGLDVLDGIEALVDRSLLRHHPATAVQPDDRYSLLASIRDYVAEHLAGAGKTAALAERHAAYYRKLTSLPSEWTWDDMASQRTAVASDLHNLRAALIWSRATGTSDNELRLALNIFEYHMRTGQYGEVRAISDHALNRTEQPSADRVRLLIARSGFEADARRFTEARHYSARAVDDARRLGEPSVLVVALSAAAVVSQSRSELETAIAEGSRLVAELASVGSHIPRWFAQYQLDVGLTVNLFGRPDESVAAQRRLLAAAPRDRVPFEQVNLAAMLFNSQRFSEAAKLLTRFEQSAEVPDAGPKTELWGRLVAALVRTVTGKLVQARIDIDLAEDRLRSVDMPEFGIQVAIQGAATDRALGDRAPARQRLQAILDQPASDTGPAPRAYAFFLLAVMSREDGDLARAGELLTQAWVIVVDDARDDFDLFLQCMLERAVQVSESDPAEAVRLIGLVDTHRNGEVFYLAVTYDTAAMLTDLRARLGDDEVTRILTDAATQPLPDTPDW